MIDFVPVGPALVAGRGTPASGGPTIRAQHFIRVISRELPAKNA